MDYECTKMKISALYLKANNQYFGQLNLHFLEPNDKNNSLTMSQAHILRPALRMLDLIVFSFQSDSNYMSIHSKPSC